MNGELDGLDRFVHDAAVEARGGRRLVAITFHSLEDRIVKHTMRGLPGRTTGSAVLTEKPLVASDAERGGIRARAARSRGVAMWGRLGRLTRGD